MIVSFQTADRLELGHAKDQYLPLLQHVWSLDWLFHVTEDSEAYSNGIAQGHFYAQSWALVHFWFCSPQMSEAS
ncbi:MAG: hypothetical protein HC897_14825 [Thermoanaerobaculia bacterium]|nr:hypothetical protein [Thermoanaerobaculia bacterium]